MANIIEIDLDKNIIIPIKEPFTKEQLIDTLAAYWGYDKGETITSRKTFKGTFDDFKKEIEGKNINIILIEKGVVEYEITEQVPFEQKKTEWVISKYLSPSTDAIISILLEIQSKEDQEKLQNEIAKKQQDFEAKKEQVKTYLDQIRDIKLN
jgi:NADP-dependent 3-hydroxy acid dehydrogenase YdfG